VPNFVCRVSTSNVAHLNQHWLKVIMSNKLTYLFYLKFSYQKLSKRQSMLPVPCANFLLTVMQTFSMLTFFLRLKFDPRNPVSACIVSVRSKKFLERLQKMKQLY
jgi:hypothetical protein